MPAVMPNKIKGSVLLARLTYVRARGGQATLDQILATLLPEDRAVLQGKLWEGGFYPFDVNLRLDAAISHHFNPTDPDKTLIEMGRASAEENLKGAQAVFLTPGEPQRFMALSPQIYSFYYTVGRRTYEKTGATSGLLRTFDAADVTKSDCLTVRGWYERGLELCGARSVSSAHPLCRAKGDPICEYSFRWL